MISPTPTFQHASWEQGCWIGAMAPQLVPEQHTVVSNMKFLVPGLGSWCMIQLTALLAIASSAATHALYTQPRIFHKTSNTEQKQLRKGTTSRYSRIFILKRLYLWSHSSYELELWYEYCSIILLHSQGIPSPAHFLYGRGARPRRSRSKIAVLCLTLAVHRSGQEPCCSF